MIPGRWANSSRSGDARALGGCERAIGRPPRTTDGAGRRVHPRAYTFQFDVTTWGWIHLILGVVIGFAGWGLLPGRTWARAVAIILAGLSVIANFLFIPYYPFWSIIAIAIGVFVIWAVAAHGRELRDASV